MKKLFLSAFLSLLIFFSVSAQYEWRSKACLPSFGRTSYSAFTIGTKAYIVAGINSSFIPTNQVWAYDEPTNTWSQLNNFPLRVGGSSCFVISDTAYVGLGLDENNFSHKQFYKYNVGSDTWSEIDSFPGGERSLAMSFAVNGKGYVGCGFDGSEHNDFYEYNPTTNSWVAKANFPGTARQTGMGISLGNTGVIGFGYDGAATSDLYRYNPSTNTWSQIANSSVSPRWAGGSFVLNDTLYVVGGENGPFYGDCWRYNSASNTWTQMDDYSCIARPRVTHLGFSIGSHGYIFGGDIGLGTGYNDLLEFGPRDTTFILQRSILVGIDTHQINIFPRVISVNARCAIWSTGAVDSQITISVPGKYWARYSDGCNMHTDTINVVQLNVGINEVTTSDFALAYPNPTSEVLTLSVDNSLVGTTFYLTDMTGRNISDGIIQKRITSINLGSFESGIYILSVKDKSIRVIKQ